jgi:hypothetical protein
VVGIVAYVKVTRPVDRIGTIAFWLFVVVQFGLWASQPWTPPPPSVDVLAYVGIASWLFALWAWWFDKHRMVNS